MSTNRLPIMVLLMQACYHRYGFNHRGCKRGYRLSDSSGEKVGLVSVHLYRPFSVKYLAAVLPATTKRIAVLDRTKEPGASGEPLYMDIVEAFANGKDIKLAEMPIIVGGRYGLGSHDTTPAQILQYMRISHLLCLKISSLGIVDDVTLHHCLRKKRIALGGKGMFE